LGGQGGTGGAGGGGQGGGYGGGIFIQGGTKVAPATVTLGAGQTADQITTISGVIADVHGSGGTTGRGGSGGLGGTGGLIIQGLGTVVLDATNTFTGGIELQSGTLELEAPGAAGSGPIIFGTGNIDPDLVFTPSTAPAGPIENFGPSDYITVTDFRETSEKYDNGILTLVGQDTGHGDKDVTIQFAIDNPDPDTGFPYSNIETSATCFCPGTRILTDKGEVAVEQLGMGDRVVTLHGEARPIKWIGRRSYDGRFVAGKPLMLPVCIKQGAISRNLPARDLWVSPGHAICIDGALIPAWLLVNGASVTQAERVDTVSYLHVELDEHDVIFAEGCPAESFLDDGCRNQFQNAAEFRALYPDSDPGFAGSCLPRIEDGFHLQAIQRRLAERAGLAIASDQRGPLRGYVDVAGPGTVAGWAQNVSRPEDPVCLDILVDGRRVVRALANRYRADLREAGLGSGQHAFEVALPPGVSGHIEIRRSSDRASLALTEAAAALAA
jgi:autotransporter-associated beta strand protein